MPFKNMPDACFKLWERVYNASKEAGDDEEKAAKKAYGAIKNTGWAKGEDGNWYKTKSLTEFSLRIERASYDKATNERRWRAVASDTDEDSRSDNMSMQLFNDFLHRIATNELAPEEFRSDFWQGGMPYVSVSHYSDLNGDGVPGPIDAIYIDGNYLKAKGKFDDNKLGRRCFEAICAELYGEKSNTDHDRVRISIGFLDWGHQHKSNNFIFERKSIDDICPQCLKEMLTGEGEGLIFLLGQLVHLALTRVPVNKRTIMEVDKSMATKTRKDDAASIVGDELAEELEEKSTMVSKSDILVTRSEDESSMKCPKCGESVTPTSDGKCPKCDAKMGDKETAEEDKSETVVEIPVVESIQEVPEVSAVVETPSLTTESIAEVVRSILAEQRPEPKPAHPLDEAFSIFRSAFDEVIAFSGSEEEKMKLVQEPFNALGSGVVSVIKSSIKHEKAEPPKQEDSIASAISEAITKAMNPLTQQLEMLSAQLSQASQADRIPQRRSISPASVIKSEAETPVKSQTPKLRALIDRTVG